MPTTVILSNGREVVFSDELSDEEIFRRAKQMDEAEQAMLANPNAMQPRSTVTGMTANEAQARASAGLEAFKPAAAMAARVGLPIAAAVAAPIALPAAAAATAGGVALSAGIGALSGAGSEFVAQTIEQLERDKVQYDPRAISASALAGAAPMIRGGSLATRVGVNVPSALGTSELSRFIAMGEDEQGKSRYTPFEDSISGYAYRYGLPVALAGAGSLGGSTAARSKEAQANIARIQSDRGAGSRVTLSEAIPDYINIERAAIARGSQLADDILNDLSAPIGPKIEAYFKDIPDVDPIFRDLEAKRDLFNRVQDDYLKAQAVADRAAQEAQAARAASGRDATAKVAKANLDAFQATAAKVKLSETVLKELKGVESRSIGSVSAGVRDNNLRSLITSADNHMKSAIDDAYALAGYDNNTPVVSLPDVMEQIDAMAKNPKNRLSNPGVRDEMKEIVENYFLEKKVDGNKLDLLHFKRIRNDMENRLVLKNLSESEAAATARDAYNAIADAADSYIARTNPQYMPAWSAAQSLAKSRFDVIGTPTFKIVTADPKVSAEISNTLYKSMKESGRASQVADDVRKIATTIAASYDATNPVGRNLAIDAANRFVANMNSSLADALLSETRLIGKGVRTGLDAFDPDKIATELDALDAVGFRPEQLGLGTSKTMRSLARVIDISEKAKGAKMITQAELNEFLDNAAIIGGDRAAWKLEHQRAVRDMLIASGAKERGNAAARAEVAARNAKLSLRDAELARAKALSNPLVRMFEDSNFKISSDEANNGNLLGKMMTMPKDTLAKLVNAFKERRSPSDLENLEKLRVAAAAQIMRQYESSINGLVPRVKLKELHDFFYKAGPEDEIRKKYIALLGKDEFDNLERNFGRPIKGIVQTTEQLTDASREGTRSAIAVRPRQTFGNDVNITFYGDFKRAVDLIRNGRYNTLYKMYVDPKWAPKVQAAGGALDMAINKTPALGAILNISRDRDDRGRQPR